MRIVMAVIALVMGLIPIAQAQDDYEVLGQWRRYSDAENALYNHIAAEAYAHLDARDVRVDGLLTCKDWTAYTAEVRKKLASAFGPLPEKTPLNARITRTFEHEGITVENVLFESRPGFHVTASLFRRSDLAGEKLPVVVYVCGHTADGYKAAGYQHVALNLAKKGIAAFAVDPVGQGERQLYFDSAEGKSVIGGPTNQHSYAGLQYALLGRTMAMVRLWDGMRSIDYLATRDDIDIERIGVHGRSGGGTMSSYLGAMDSRITAAAPECYITSFRRLFQSIGPQDAEQNLLSQISSGLDHGDFLAARMPKATLVVTTTRDFFSIQGARETVKQLAPGFDSYEDAPGIAMIEDDAPHQSTKLNRERVYRFFMDTFGVRGDNLDEDIPPIDPAQLQVTETGQISTSGSKAIHDLILDDAGPVLAKLDRQRKRAARVWPETVKGIARDVSGYREHGPLSGAVFTGRIQADGYAIEKYILDADSDLPLPALLYVPSDGGDHCGVLYISEKGKACDVERKELIEPIVRSGAIVMACDIPGTGELSVDKHRDDSVIKGVNYNIVFGAQLIGRSVTAIQAEAIVRAADYLKRRSDVIPSDINVVSMGITGPAVLHASAFCESIGRTVLIGSPLSWESVVRERMYSQAIGSTMVPSALLHYDLPDLAASLAPRCLMYIDPVGGDGDPVDSETRRSFAGIVKPYYDAGGSFDVCDTDSPQSVAELIVDRLSH